MSSRSQLLKYAICVVIYIFILSFLFFKTNYPSKVLIFHSNKTSNVFFVPPTTTSSDENEEATKKQIIHVNSTEEEIEAKIIEPLQLISSICEKYNKTTSLVRTRFLYSPKHRVLYCWFRKVASTSFSKFFADLRGLHITRNYYKYLDALAPESIEELLNLVDDTSVFKFLVVRHPFERIVSSFRNRIEDNSKYSAQSWSFVPRIFYFTRPELFHFNESTGNPLQKIFDIDRRLKIIPTFREFINWLIRQPEEHDDDHWSQYHSHCSICQMSFDFILKIDAPTIQQDLDYLFSNFKQQSQLPKLQKLSQTRGGSTMFKRTCLYLSQLNKSTFDQLYNRYKIDFEMFGYSPDAYRNCIKS